MKTNKQQIIPNEIIHLVADINYTTIFFIDGSSFYSSYTLGYFEKKYTLPSNFLRISRSTIINTDFLGKIKIEEGKMYAYLQNGNCFKISRRKTVLFSKFV